MRPRIRKVEPPTSDDVLSHMKRGAGLTDNQLAQRCYVSRALLDPVVMEMLLNGQLVRFRSGRAMHLFIAGTEPAANVPTRRPSPLEDPRDISECSYCTDFRNHRALAELTRGHNR